MTEEKKPEVDDLVALQYSKEVAVKKIEVDDLVALQYGRDILSQKRLPEEHKKITADARNANAIATTGVRICNRIRLLAGRVGFISKRERDMIRHALGELDSLEESFNQRD